MYKKAIRAKFKTDLLVKGLENEICSYVRRIVLNDYKGVEVISNEVKYQIHDVRVNFAYNKIGTPPVVYVTPVLFCSSKLPKAKLEILNKIKQDYEETNRLPDNKYKKPPLYKRFYFEFGLQSILDENYRLPFE